MAWTKDQCTQLRTAEVYFPERNKTDAHIQIFVERGK
jgi:hypothetical protein